MMSYFVIFTCLISLLLFFFFNDTATTEIYTLSLHDALPICHEAIHRLNQKKPERQPVPKPPSWLRDRKSTRLNSSHRCISYAVFCLKKKKNKKYKKKRNYKMLTNKHYSCSPVLQRTSIKLIR